jgi:hypothetical protein
MPLVQTSEPLLGLSVERRKPCARNAEKVGADPRVGLAHRIRSLNFKSSSALLSAVFALRQQIPKHCGFSAVQTRLAFMDKRDDAKRVESACNVVCFLMAQAIENFCCIAVTQKVVGDGQAR